MSESAIALFDEQGAVVAWTQAAERLVGYSASDMAGCSAAVVLPSFGEAPTVSAFVEQCRVRNGWPGVSVVRHRDGRLLDTILRMSKVRGYDGTTQWLASVTDIGTLSREAVNGPVRGALLTRAPIGVSVRDRQLRCTGVSDAMETHDGIPPDRRLGRPLTDVMHGVKAEGLEEVMRQVLKSGTTKVHEYRTWLPAALGPEHPFAVSFACLQGVDGQPSGVCITSVDVTASQQARERLAILNQAGTRLGTSLDVMQTSQALADLAVPLLADFAAVDLEQWVPFGEGPAVSIDASGERYPVLRRAGLASVHPGVPESPWTRGEPITLPHGSPLTDVFNTGSPHLEPILDTAPGTWINQDHPRAHKIHEYGMHSLMVVPIRTRRALLGIAVFIRTKDPVPFQDADLLLAEELVSRAAVSLDNALRYARQHTTALALQRNLLPHRLRGGAAVETASRYLPADIDHGVGGDWFDVIPLSGARVALVVGDVVGHGINAAVTMGRLRTAVRTLADMDLPPDELLTHLDDTVQRLVEEDAEPPDQASAVVGATCLYAVYDPVTGRCTMASAGHPPPAIVDRHGGVTFPDLPTGIPLGVGLGIPIEAVELELPEGTLLALYTDGMIETRGQDIEDGMRRLGAALTRPNQSLEELCTRAMEPFVGQAACDDVTLLLVRTRALAPSQVASWTLPSDNTAAGRARNLAATQLAEWGLEGLENATRLIVSELVTNAARHGTGPVQLRLIKHDFLTCEVSDSDVGFPRQRRAHTLDEHGRGLSLVSRRSRRWGYRPIPGGKVVWAEQTLPPRESPPAREGQPAARRAA
ncbi:SpoIIE family protein phosphatase [Streptomyces sp. NPDC086077]|uniref:SpoIIE family protein phosphatase n=1 Tax=Streptomyces sp. NPDC086077 TaxID=3154862 RepID=UPI0034341ED0